MASRVGFLGLGSMGGAIARRIAAQSSAASLKLTVYDVNPSSASKFDSVAKSSQELFDNSDVVLTCLPNSDIVRDVLTSNEIKPNTVVVDLTSGDPSKSFAMSEELKAKNVTYLDMPVSGGPAGSEAGNLTAMASGDPEVYASKVEGIAKLFSKKVEHVGPKPGSGHAVKAINNTLNMMNLLSASEGLIALNKAGIDTKKALDIINESSGRSLQSTVRIPDEIMSGRYNYGFQLGLMMKDVNTGTKFVSDQLDGQGLVLDDEFASLVESLTALSGPDSDYTEAVKSLEVVNQSAVHGIWVGEPVIDDIEDDESGASSSSSPLPLVLPSTTELLVCDMAGTTVDEQGLVYITLHSTMNDHGLDVPWEDMHVWHGAEKIAVIEHFVRSRFQGKDEDKIIAAKNACFKDFVKNIEKAYFEADVLKLIDPGLPEHFNELRSRGVKIGLNTGYPIKIQEAIIEKLNMREFIDGYVSAEQVGGRPNPWMIHRLMLDFKVNHVLKVAKAGDSVADIGEGQSAGVGINIGVLSGADSKETLMNAGAGFILNSVMDVKIGDMAE